MRTPRIRIDARGCVWFYGNPVGYVREDCATIDADFLNKELYTSLTEQQGLSIQYEPGVLELVLSGRCFQQEKGPPLKAVRIWQLAPTCEVSMKFIGYEEMVRKFGEPCQENYHSVFDGEPDTNDLEGLYNLFHTNPPAGYTGHLLSISDVMELYDEKEVVLYYVDRQTLRKLGGWSVKETSGSK